MGAALEIITGRAVLSTAATAFTTAVMAAGDALTVRNAPLDSKVFLLQTWADFQNALTYRLRSPNLHDNVQGLRFEVPVGEVDPLLPMGHPQRLIPQDTLILEIDASATTSAIENVQLMLYYENLLGIDARFITPDAVKQRTKNIVTVENTLATGTAGGYSGEEAINAEFDLLRANVEYALLGYVVSVECAGVHWRGSDTGNLRVGGPGNNTDRHLTQNWFVELSRIYGMPLIPVFNSANRAGILLDAVQDDGGTDVVVNSIFAELMPAGAAVGR